MEGEPCFNPLGLARQSCELLSGIFPLSFQFRHLLLQSFNLSCRGEGNFVTEDLGTSTSGTIIFVIMPSPSP